jgi:hypothetical protein
MLAAVHVYTTSWCRSRPSSSSGLDHPSLLPIATSLTPVVASCHILHKDPASCSPNQVVCTPYDTPRVRAPLAASIAFTDAQRSLVRVVSPHERAAARATCTPSECARQAQGLNPPAIYAATHEKPDSLPALSQPSISHGSQLDVASPSQCLPCPLTHLSSPSGAVGKLLLCRRLGPPCGLPRTRSAQCSFTGKAW